MEDITIKINTLLKKSGQNSRYQIFMVFIFFGLFLATEYIKVGLPYIEANPYIINGTKDYLLNYTHCSQKDFDESKIKANISSLVIDNKIYCQRHKITFIGIVIFGGKSAGGMIAYLFADNLGRKNTLLGAIPLHILSLVICFFNKSYYTILVNFFFIGLTAYIIMITMIVYTSEIVDYNYIHLYITLIVSGLPFGRIVDDFLFVYFQKKNWRYTLFITAGLVLLLYIPMAFYIVESPLFYLNNGNIEMFKKSVNKIAKKNNKELGNNDFNFIQKPSLLKINKNSDEDIQEMTGENTRIEMLIPHNKKNKEETGLEINNPGIFGKYKMKDYSPLDLIRYKSQLKTFLILTFLWSSTLGILHGLNIFSKYYPDELVGKLWIQRVALGADVIAFIIVLISVLIKKFGIFRTLTLLQLSLISILFISFLFSDDHGKGLHSDNFKHIVCLYLAQFFCSGLYLIMYIITAEVYPAMIRTKGLGWNKAFGEIGALIGPILVEYIQDTDDLILYYITLAFFGIVFAFVLPHKIGTLEMYHLPEHKPEKENIKRGIFESSEIKSDDNDGEENIEET